MNRTPSSQNLKKMIVDILERDNFVQHYSDKITEIITALRLDSQNTSNYANFYEQIASWVIDNYPAIKNNILAFFQGPNFQNLSDIPKQYLVNLLTTFSKKLNDQNPGNEIFPMKNNGYNHYSPYNYPYSPQGYPMNNPSMMYPHPPYYGNNTEQFEKLYREQLQYYMQMQQMPMNFPSYMQGYGMAHDQYNPQMKNNTMPDQMARAPNISISKSAMSRNMADQSKSEAEINKNSLKEPATSTKSVEDYEDTFKRYYDMYGKNLGKEAPFIIIPPSKKRGVKTKIIQNFQKKKEKVLQGMQKNAIEKQNQSSDLQVVENPNIPKTKKGEKQKNPPYWFIGKQKLEQPNIQLSNCLCRGLVNDPNFFKCSKCEKSYHYDCLKLEKPEPDNHICHFCYMNFIDPLNEVTEIIKIEYLQNIADNKMSTFANFQQFMNQIQAKGNQYEIELRCMRLQDAVNRNPEYTWPDQCIISLNGEKALEFQALQLHSSVKKRKDSSIFITYMIYHENKYLRSLANLKMGMEIKNMSQAEMGQKKIRNNFVFIIGIYLTKKKLVEELYEEIMNEQNNKVKFAENYFNLPDLQQIAIEQIKVNLLDPYTWNMIETPARGKKCTHGQCFDLKTYIGFMNIQRNRNWRCPVCSKECRNLLVDTQQLQAIKQYKRQQQQSPEKSLAPEIVFHKDGRTLFSIQTDGDQQQNISKSKEQKERNE